MTTRYLHTLGRADYSDHLRTLTGMTAAWADIDGWHQGPPPDTAPTATHLWAWSDDSTARFRIDGDHAVGAVLNESPTHPAAVRSDEVQVRVDTPENWGVGEKRIKADLAPHLDMQWQLITVIDDPAVTFVRQHSAD